MSEWELAIQAAQSRKAEDIVLLKIGPANSFTDYFVICTGTNPRQVQAIADSIETALKSEGVRPIGVEGYRTAEWVLLDYGDFIVHVFSPQSRQFYGLERLWKNAARLPLPDVQDSGRAEREDRFRAVPASN
jgi:ribosome-associated protein